MAGKSNAIGTGALILSANADEMVADLGAASGRINAWANKTRAAVARGPGGKGGIVSTLIGGASGGAVAVKGPNSKGGLLGGMAGAGKAKGPGGKGGLLGGLTGAGSGGATLLGGLAGGVAGAGLFSALVKGPELAMRAFDELDKKAQGFDKKALKGIQQSFKGIQNAGLGILQKFVTAAAPAIVMLSEKLLGFLEKMTPYIDAGASAFEAFLFVGIELFGELLDLIAEVIDSVAGWLGEITGLSAASDNFGQVMLGVLRAVGKGFAYVWDTLKAGAGVIVYVAGLVVQGFGLILGAIADATKALDRLAKELPESIRPDWIGGAAEAVDGWANSAKQAGEQMQNWGRNAVLGFGNSAGKVDAWFDRLQHNLDDKKKQIENLAIDFKLTGANLKGSTEAFSIVAKYEASNMLSEQQTAKKHLKEAEKHTILLKQLVERGGSQIVLGSI